MTDNDGSSSADKLAEIRRDLQSLQRVGHRLALIDTADRLQQVLDKLLPRLLQRIGDNNTESIKCQDARLKQVYDQSHKELVEMISHVMKRVRNETSCQLPCRGILQLLVLPRTDDNTTNSAIEHRYNAAVNSFTINLSLAFLTLGAPRIIDATIVDLLPGLLALLGHYATNITSYSLPVAKVQHGQIVNLLLVCLEKTTTSTLDTPTLRTASGPSSNNKSSLQTAQNMVANDDRIAAAFFDLLLDVFLYETPPTSSTLPPAGLSSSGNDRLKGRLSKASAQSIVTLQLTLLDWVAPCRKWCIFVVDKENNSAADKEDDAIVNKSMHYNILNRSRMVALLAAGTSGVHKAVVDQATMYLKMHLDSVVKSPIGDLSSHNGNFVVLSCALLSLALGQSAGESLVKSVVEDNSSTKQLYTTLGWTFDLDGSETSASNRPIVYSTKRRAVNEVAQIQFLNFVSIKILQDNPSVWNTTSIKEMTILAKVGLGVVEKSLGSQNSSFSGGSLKSKLSMEVAQLLQLLTVRLTHYTEYCVDDVIVTVGSFLSQVLNISCEVLARYITQVRGSLANHNESEYNWRIRDYCYGSLSCIFRSKVVTAENSFVFKFGDSDSIVGTASLLFSCSSREIERLRPRSVESLDALLTAYKRVFQRPAEIRNGTLIKPSVVANPWSVDTSEDIDASIESIPSEPAEVNQLSSPLLSLLWTASQVHQSKSSRESAAKWCKTLLVDIDPANSYHLLCFLAGDADSTASSAAREALGYSSSLDQLDDVAKGLVLPKFDDFANAIFSSHTSGSSTKILSFGNFSKGGKAAALKFALRCLYSDMYSEKDEHTRRLLDAVLAAIYSFRATVESAGLPKVRLALELLEVAAICLESLLHSSEHLCIQLLSSKCQLSLADLEQYALNMPSSVARKNLAAACGVLYAKQSLWQSCDISWSDAIASGLKTCVASMDSFFNKGRRFEKLHGSVFLGAHLVRTVCNSCTEHVEEGERFIFSNEFLEFVCRGIGDADESVGNTCVVGIETAFSIGGTEFVDIPDSFARSIGNIFGALKSTLLKYYSTDHVDTLRVTNLVRTAGVCLAASSSLITKELANLGSLSAECSTVVFNTLSSAAVRKENQIALLVGEALASQFISLNKGPIEMLADWPVEYDEAVADSLPPRQNLMYILLHKYTLSSMPLVKNAACPALLAFVARCLRYVKHSVSSIDGAATRLLHSKMTLIQEIFLKLLADPKLKQLARESCCLGLAACRGLADSLSSGSKAITDFDTKVVRAFGKTKKYGTSALVESREDEDDRDIGGVSGLSEASFGAYRIMVTACIEIGRTDLLYGLLILSASDTTWFVEPFKSTYNFSSLLGSTFFEGKGFNLVDLRSALQPFLGTLLPQLLRACYDPNKQTQEQMKSVWLGLVGTATDGKAVISKFFLSTFDSLIKYTSAKDWRCRAGSGGALSEIIAGRDWDDLGGGPAIVEDDDLYTPVHITAGVRLLRLWRVTVRSLDDTRDGVRTKGQTLGRTLKALTVRLCNFEPDEQVSGSKRTRLDTTKIVRDASAAAQTSLRWMMKHGITQQCGEATGLCMGTLVEIVGVSNAEVLEPVLPTLIRSLLLAISALEPAALNYMQYRIENQDAYERGRLQLAQSSPLATAVNKCVDMLPPLSSFTQQAVVSELGTSMKMSSGFATRSATADAISTLCRTCPEAFKGSSATIASPATQLLHTLYTSIEREQGEAAKEKLTHAFGNLAAHCSGQAVRLLTMKACRRYRLSSGNYDNPSSRRAAAAIIKSICVRATHHLADGGKSDIWQNTVFPVAYVGQFDFDSKVASLWAEVWTEGRHSCSFDGIGSTPEEQLLSYIVNECVDALNEVSWTRRVSAANALLKLCSTSTVRPLGSKATTSKRENDLRLESRAQASIKSVTSCMSILIKRRLWTGKSRVLEAAYTLIAGWIPQINSERSDFAGNIDCRQKVIIAGTAASVDLFLDDNWFHVNTSDNATSYDSLEDVNEAAQILEEHFGTENELSDIDDPITTDMDKPTTTTNEWSTNVANNKTFKPLVLDGLLKWLLSEMFKVQPDMVHSEELLPYRICTMKALCCLMEAYPLTCDNFRQNVYIEFTNNFIPSADKTTPDQKTLSPVLVAKGIDCLSKLFWDDFDTSVISNGNNSIYEVQSIVCFLSGSNGAKHSAWTVRVASLNCTSRLVQATSLSTLASKKHSLAWRSIEMAEHALQDRKFSNVRIAGVSLLKSLVLCVDATNEVMLRDVLLPHKDDIQRLAKLGLKDSEPRVTSLASEVLQYMSWWP